MHDGWRGLNDLTSGARVVPDAAALAFPIAGQAAYEARVEVHRIDRHVEDRASGPALNG
jgi:hypothetical protein